MSAASRGGHGSDVAAAVAAARARVPGLDGAPAERGYLAFADALLPAVRAAAGVQLAYFRTGAQVETKADASPVTAADRESEALLVAALATLAPGVPVVAEEAAAAGAMPVLSVAGDDVFFLIDPLDGTREFVAGRDEFTINVALVARHIPVFGLIYVPAGARLYVTLGTQTAVAADTPADDARPLRELTVRTLSVREADAAHLVAAVSRSHMTPATEAMLTRLAVVERKIAGSSEKFCRIAAGEADVYPRAGVTNEWDIAAGHAILRAAGGEVVDRDGAPIRYGKADAKFRNPDYIAWGRMRGPMPRL
jgi:3'(2'), 5'-bisphosphate nucleotidase